MLPFGPLLLVALSEGFPSNPVRPSNLADQGAIAAAGVLHRTFPTVANDFRFATIPNTEQSNPRYEVSASGGRVTVRGTDGVAMCRGAYDYLRKAVGAEFTWSGASLGASAGKLPDMRLAVTSPYRHVLQDNVCTFGYTTAFYGWDQWQRYLDVMALHGVNMEFSPVGGEAIWQRVWRSLGIGQDDLDNFFTGPAFLPWHRMGNVNKHDGPLPQSYLRESIPLEKRILGRMRELGIEPIAPAFAGFVPPGFERAYPKEQVIHVGSWAGFQGPDRTQLLHPLSSMYSKIGGAFIKAWTKEFGSAHFYLADSFNELQVPVPDDRTQRLEQLAAFGQAVYDGIRSGDPNGTWVMQGWLFFNEKSFWDKESVQALLSKVPDDKMIILDLFAEADPIWKMQDAFYGKGWIVSNITTWGGNNQAYGNFGIYSKLSADTLAAPNHGNLIGYGMSFEGSESNEAQYELMCDTAWRSQPVDVPGFLVDTLVRSRYGGVSDAAVQAWQEFARSVYDMAPGIHPNHLLQHRPYNVGLKGGESVDASDEFKKGVELLVSARDRLGMNPLYRNDVVQLLAQWELVEADRWLRDSVVALGSGATQESLDSEKQFVRLANEADRLLASHPLDRLARWVQLARDWGTTRSDKNYYEADAKRQVTVWGGPDLSEYAAKMWAGLIQHYYVPRWTQWLDTRRTGGQWDSHFWEESWITTHGGFDSEPFADPLQEAPRIVAELKALPTPETEVELQGQELGRWRSGETDENYRQRTWNVTKLISGNGTLAVRFQYTSGACRLDINGVELLANEMPLSADPHLGHTGDEDAGNIFHLKVQDFSAGKRYEIRANVRSDGGSDSNGVVYVHFSREIHLPSGA